MSSVDWYLIRATGLTATVLLTAAMVFGLMMSLRIGPRRLPGAIAYDLHRFVTGLALWTVGAHVLLLLIDAQAGVGLMDLVVPFASGTRTFATGLGTIAFVAMTIIWFSSIHRMRIGQRAWRMLHRLTFLAYVTAMAHGILGGTDSGAIWVWPLHVAGLLLVGALTVRRIMLSRRVPPASSASPPATTRPVPGHAVSGLPPLGPRSAPPAWRQRGDLPTGR